MCSELCLTSCFIESSICNANVGFESPTDFIRFILDSLLYVKSQAINTVAAIAKKHYNMGTFDYSSIMLYSSYDISMDSNISTMTIKDGTTFIGQRKRLSDGDRKFYLLSP